MINKTDIASMTKAELCEYFKSLGEPKFRAEQVFSWISRGASFDEMTNLSKVLREKLKENCLDTLPKVKEKLVSKIDGTVKYLFELYDGSCIESVFMKYKHGNTICISSQVGCRMGCRFCASTIGGKVRDLLPSELLGQVIAAERDSGKSISNIVMMGIGEPLDNYDNVIRFLKLVNAEGGLNIGYRHISLSTCGIVPKILALAEEELPITLSISLHAADDETRDGIMPVNRAYPIAELLSACLRYFKTTGRRICFEYTLIQGKNDSREQAQKLAVLLNRALRTRTETMPIHVNLIPVNEVKERDFTHSDKKAVAEFARILEKHGIRATVRRKLGADINASCGQLRREDLKAKGEA